MFKDTNIEENLTAVASPVVTLSIVAGGKPISHFKHFKLSQSAAGHHRFTLLLDYDIFGEAEDHQME
ncbi:MAG: hypothetical protein LBE82_01930, partial [Chitinophagaceae bacterium]|nr:hypothetical protein [Chitinophagaceae bacterium]